ncbi:MAG TPA: hypothetical protein VHZ53_15465 [Steroidobacteraceae bacterium]|jgi:cyclic beta-1,2-glucan synthetase|nr:hypothetical protein [Steroidobacteraceae bacterium]
MSPPDPKAPAPAASRRFTSPQSAAPRTQLLSNGSYSVMVTAAGSGYSRWGDIAVSRWREDPTCDSHGSYVYLRDVADGTVWSAAYQPVGSEPDSYEAQLGEDRVRITRADGPVVTSTEILVSPEADAEMRRVSVTNRGRRTYELEITSYAEVVLATPEADAAHPAFSKMFVQTEWLADSGTLLATRRTRSPEDPKLWVSHHSTLDGTGVGGLQIETDRARFIGRGRDLRTAAAVLDARPLSGTTGTVLDPVLALRRRVRIAPGKTARLAFWTAIAGSRESVLATADRYREAAAAERIQDLARDRAGVRLRDLGIDPGEARRFQWIANRVLYADSTSRAPRETLERNRSGASGLWPHGISGDLPIVLARAGRRDDVDTVARLERAQAYWRSMGLAVDVVILNEAMAAEAAELQQALEAALGGADRRPPDETAGRRGKLFILRTDSIPAASRDLLLIAARVVLGPGDAGAEPEEPVSAARPRLEVRSGGARESAARTVPALEYYNGLGGFSADGREYMIMLDEGHWTPAPWNNVIANPEFGFQASADGTGTTWSINAQQNQLTPWSNDPVSNTPAEVIYLRDEETGEVWTPTPLPIREHSALYVIRHGFGHTRYELASHGIAVELLQYVPLEDPIKIARLKVTNRSGRPRRLSVTHYVDWVLGNQRARLAPFTITEIEPSTGALLARNPWGTEFPSRVAFMDMAGRQQSCTADRREFLGRHGALAEPAALTHGGRLSGCNGAGLDPCGAMQTSVRLRDGESAEVVLLLGEEATPAAAVELMQRYRAANLDAVLEEVTRFWDRVLCTLEVKTPDRPMDLMVNGWLLYQTLACRVWARTGFYQSSGAYGYRDQLQDVAALCAAHPAVAREHILRAAGRQFAQGDVQHWWLPESGKGIQTLVSDDRIWLPFILEHYLEVTGDTGVLDEQLPFLAGGPLAPGVHESFFAPEASPEIASLFEHCVRALDSSLAIGSHGLPLFGTGDWNDGMNRVGARGRGESVWMAWFLYAALLKFAPIAAARGRMDRADQWRKHAFALQQAIEREAWDGDWYRRGYYDDGTPLGSVSSDECRIDAIAQSWAVISGGGDPARAARAMAAVDNQLVDRADGLVKLFTPAFDQTAHDPGYIKGYPPGLRENGGQYTHAAMWTNLAFALLGDGDRAGEVFSILNPVNHATTRASAHRYKVEPYVVCADVYSVAPHTGRGGWTWYTGSAGWMYRTAAEGILGVRLRAGKLSIDPCIPRTWPAFEVTHRHGASRYRIAVENPRGVCRGVKSATLDGARIGSSPCEITLVDDGKYHYAVVTLG